MSKEVVVMKTRSLIVIIFCFPFVLANSAFAQNYVLQPVVVSSAELQVGSEPAFYGLSDNQKRDDQTEVKTNARIVTKFKKKKPIGYEVSDGRVSVRSGNIVVIGKGTVFKKGSVLPNGKTVGDAEMMFDGKAYIKADEQ